MFKYWKTSFRQILVGVVRYRIKRAEAPRKIPILLHTLGILCRCFKNYYVIELQPLLTIMSNYGNASSDYKTAFKILKTILKYVGDGKDNYSLR